MYKRNYQQSVSLFQYSVVAISKHSTMLKRLGESKEIAGPIIFLLSKASSYITGQVLKVDGGWTAW